jgi:hypothetical protein
MCQLSLASLKNNKLNLSFVISQMQVNSALDHNDGTGIFGSEGLFKTKNSAKSLVQSVPQIREKIKNNRPVCGHVRKASFSLTNKLVDDEHAHPFESDNFILAHNGTLVLKDKTIKTPDNLIDTQIFLNELEREWNGNIIESLNKAMKKFTGKFAFLIYCKPDDSFYIVRGLATLFKHDMYIGDEYLGFVINTEKDHLDKNIVIFQNQVELWTGKCLNVLKDNATLLLHESIFRINEKTNTIIRIGDIKEETAYTAVTPYYNKPQNTVPDTKVESPYEFIFKFLSDMYISLSYLDTWLYSLIGKGVLSLEEGDMPLIKEILSYAKTISNPKLIAEYTALANLKHYTFIHYSPYFFPFPYFMYPDKINVLRKIKEELK